MAELRLHERLRRYDRMAAVNYAVKHAFSYNTEWPTDVGLGGDCTNFVSQALHAGGWTMIWPGTMFAGGLSWYSPKVPGTPSRWLNRSRSWAAAQNFHDFLSKSGRASRCSKDELVHGDVVQLKDYDIVHHTMIVTGLRRDPNTGAKVSLLTYHTKDTLDKPITELSERKLICWKVYDFFLDPLPEPVMPRVA